MTDFHDNVAAQKAADAQRQQDFDDLQHEIRGDSAGRVRRFLNRDDERTPEGKRRKAEREQTRRTLEQLMRDPVYAQLYTELGDRLGAAETNADATLSRLEEQIAQETQLIDDMENHAARAPDGRAVFRFSDGRVVYADGTVVGEDIAAGIIWPPGAPSAEDYFAAKLRKEALEEQLMEWTTYRYDTLGDIRDRYDSEDRPMSKDELQDALEDIEKLAPASVQLTQSDGGYDVTTVRAPSKAVIPTVLK